MATYIILSRIVPSSEFKEPKDFKEMAARVSKEIKKECPGVDWLESFVILGRFDVIDIIQSDDLKQVEKAAMIIRSLGHSTTETMLATPWRDFLASL